MTAGQQRLRLAARPATISLVLPDEPRRVLGGLSVFVSARRTRHLDIISTMVRMKVNLQ